VILLSLSSYKESNGNLRCDIKIAGRNTHVKILEIATQVSTIRKSLYYYHYKSNNVSTRNKSINKPFRPEYVLQVFYLGEEGRESM